MTTLVSSIITNAFRETNLLPVGQSPTTNQQNEALDLFNTLILSTVGREAGDPFTDINIGGDFDQTNICETWVPDDVRLVLNITSATSFNLDPEPYEGQRLAFVDAGNNLATYNLTLNGNGRLIEGGSSVVLNTNGESRQWIYRADTANWAKVTSLVASDQMPFPVEFDDYFITMLAFRLNPRFSQQVSAETLQALRRARDYLRARYHNFRQIRSDVSTRGGLADPRGARWPNTSDFDHGRSWRGFW